MDPIVHHAGPGAIGKIIQFPARRIVRTPAECADHANADRSNMREDRLRALAQRLAEAIDRAPALEAIWRGA